MQNRCNLKYFIQWYWCKTRELYLMALSFFFVLFKYFFFFNVQLASMAELLSHLWISIILREKCRMSLQIGANWNLNSSDSCSIDFFGKSLFYSLWFCFSTGKPNVLKSFFEKFIKPYLYRASKIIPLCENEVTECLWSF